jgi:hypothetical protein
MKNKGGLLNSIGKNLKKSLRKDIFFKEEPVTKSVRIKQKRALVAVEKIKSSVFVTFKMNFVDATHRLSLEVME